MKRTLRKASSEPASFQFLVADEKIEQAVKSFKVKIPAAGTHTRLDDLAKTVVDPAIKAASLAVLAKVIS